MWWCPLHHRRQIRCHPPHSSLCCIPQNAEHSYIIMDASSVVRTKVLLYIYILETKIPHPWGICSWRSNMDGVHHLSGPLISTSSGPLIPSMPPLTIINTLVMAVWTFIHQGNTIEEIMLEWLLRLLPHISIIYQFSMKILDVVLFSNSIYWISMGGPSIGQWWSAESHGWWLYSQGSGDFNLFLIQ